MATFDHILHPTDLSLSAKPAFEEAIVLARKFGATLHVLHVAPTFGDDPVRNAFKVAVDEDAFYKTVHKEIEAQMEAVLEVHHVDDIAVTKVFERGNTPSDVIVEYAQANNINVIVMGTNGYKGLRRMVLGSVTANVVREAPCDVITVRNVTGIIDKAEPFDRILVPIDLEPSSKIQLKEAFDLAKQMNAVMRVVHVIEPFPLPTWAMSSDMLTDLIPSHMEHVKKRLDEMVEEVVGSELIVVESVVDEGKPAPCIVKHANDHESDLIVMTPRSSGWMDRLPLGSVAERVMASSDRPVYLVHLPGEETASSEDNREASANL